MAELFIFINTHFLLDSKDQKMPFLFTSIPNALRLEGRACWDLFKCPQRYVGIGEKSTQTLLLMKKEGLVPMLIECLPRAN